MILLVREDASLTNFFSYFTTESNLLVMISAALIAWRPDLGGKAFEILRLAALVSITITGIVYATLLAGAIDLEGLQWWNDVIFHYLVPAMSVIGYVGFRPRTTFSKGALLFIVWPVAWLAYTLARAELAEPAFRGENDTTMTVPYDFLSVDLHGVGYVAVFSAIVTLMALLIAAGYLRLGRREGQGAVLP